MKVRFARWYSALFIVPGLLIVVLSFVLIDDLGEAFPALAAGAIFLCIGLLSLGPLPYLVVRENEITVPLLGLRMFGFGSRIPLGSTDRLVMDGQRLVIRRPSGKRDKVEAWRWCANPADWDRMLRR
ncbi:hypothetical protein [Actinoplanes sp. NPDC026670]|uniref:hypothetical protein n=1 Tax=Actinoplanes sp. NPDC026670 TaxID=3154700 RepID=UPI0033D190FA